MTLAVETSSLLNRTELRPMETSSRKRSIPFQTLTLLLFSVILFMVAKNVSSANSVTIDRFEYWILGVVPVLFFHFATVKSDLFRPFGFIQWYRVWVFSLLLYLIAEINYFPDMIANTSSDFAGLAQWKVDAVLSIFCSFLSLTFFESIARVLGKSPRTGIAKFLAIHAVTGFFFYLFVFAL